MKMNMVYKTGISGLSLSRVSAPGTRGFQQRAGGRISQRVSGKRLSTGESRHYTHVVSSSSSSYCQQQEQGQSEELNDWEEIGIAPQELQITETLETPLGLLLAENTKEGYIYIESIEPDSHAEISGSFKPGDILVACSAIAMKTQGDNVSMYNRNSRGRKGGCCSTGCSDCPFNVSNWQRIMFDCRNKNFDAVIAALSSNNARWVRRNTPANITITVSRPNSGA